MRVDCLITQHQDYLEKSSWFREAGLGTRQHNNVEKYKKRPAGNVSFGGSVSSAVNKPTKKATVKLIKWIEKWNGKPAESLALKKLPAKHKGKKASPPPEWVMKLVKNKNFEKIRKLTEDHPQIFGSIVTLALTGVLKPLATLAMPGAEDKDKEQAAAKSVVTAIFGTILVVMLFTPLSHAVKKIMKKPKKYLGEDSEIAKKLKGANTRYTKAYKDLWKQGFEILLTPIRAAIVIGIMPYLAKVLFGGRDKKRKDEKTKSENIVISDKIKSVSRGFTLNNSRGGGR